MSKSEAVKTMLEEVAASAGEINKALSAIEVAGTVGLGDVQRALGELKNGLTVVMESDELKAAIDWESGVRELLAKLVEGGDLEVADELRAEELLGSTVR